MVLKIEFSDIFTCLYAPHLSTRGHAQAGADRTVNIDGVVKSPICCLAAVSGTRQYYMYCLVPEKLLRLAPQGHFLRAYMELFT
ncbi:MAG: hypothetical protein JRD71_02095 [Deltaproteobacteria bacterium]|nr:hypothetical protein [Deltaproteobacteria bacterium]